MRKKEFKTILLLLVILGILARLISSSCESSEGEVFTVKDYKSNALDSARQVVWVKVDSLNTILKKLPKDKIVYKDQGSKLSFVALDIEEFNRILLDQSYLSSYKELDNPFITLTRDGFEATVKKENEVRYVQLPAEIISSLQLSLAK